MVWYIMQTAARYFVDHLMNYIAFFPPSNCDLRSSAISRPARRDFRAA